MKNALLTNVGGTIIGIFWIIFLFIFCYLLVYFLTKKDKELNSEKDAQTPPPKPTATPKKSQPQAVYYIVERKKKRPKSDYSDPQRIHFE